MAERVDIVVSESGTDAAAQKLVDLGQAADEAAKKVDTTNSSLTFLKETSSTVASPLDQIAAAAGNANSATSTMNSALSASQSLLKQQQEAADRLGISLSEWQQRTENFRNGTNDLSQSISENTQETKNNAEATEHAAKSTEHFSEAGHVLREVLTLIGLALSTDKLIEYSNAYEKISDQLSTVSANAQTLHGFEEQLLDVSQRTGSSFSENVSSFQKLSVQSRSLGISQQDLLTTIEGVNNAVRLSGGSSQDAARALNVFERSLATGQVEGRQFRQLLTQFPALGAAVAQGLNQPISALTEFSQRSPLAAKDFIDAFNRASATAVEVGSTIRLSFESSLVVLQNSVTAYIGRLNEATGATNVLANIVLFLANNLNTIAGIIQAVATVWLSYYTILVAFPAVIGLITGAVTALTAAIAANPLGFLIVTITAVTALVYEFGNSIKITSDGSISLLGALIGVWNVFYNVISNVANFVGTVLGPVFQALGFIISGVFNLAVILARGLLSVLSLIVPALQPVADGLSSLASPLVTFKEIMVDSMTEATAKMSEAGDHTKTLAELIGGNDPVSNLVGSSERATKSVNTLASSVDNLTQMGRVNASLIPVFTGEYDRMVAAHKRASEAAKAYAEDVRAEEEAMKSMALTSRSAFGEMIKASDEWALRSGANFNSVREAAQSTSDSFSSTSTSFSRSSNRGSTRTSGDDQNTYSFSGAMYVNPALEFSGFTNLGARTMPDWLVDWFGGAISNAAQQKAAIAEFQKNAGVGLPGMSNMGSRAGMPAFAQGGAFEVGGSGGVDSQLVRFWASPGERVTVETPSQQKRTVMDERNGKTIVVNMKVVTPDADSFRRSQTQNLLTLRSKLGQL